METNEKWRKEQEQRKRENLDAIPLRIMKAGVSRCTDYGMQFHALCDTNCDLIHKKAKILHEYNSIKFSLSTFRQFSRAR